MQRESEFRLLAPLIGLALGAMAVFVASLMIWASHRRQSQFLSNMSREIRTPLNGVNAIAAALGRTSLSPAQA